MNSVKRHSPILNFPVLLVVLCFIASYGLVFLELQVQREKAKEEMSERIRTLADAGALIQFRFSLSEVKTKLEWKHSREFKLNDRMYDIVYAENTGDTITYWVLSDDKESKINQSVRELISKALGNHSDSKTRHNLIHDYFKILYCKVSGNQLTDLYITFNKQFYPSNSVYHSIRISPPSPPPKG